MGSDNFYTGFIIRDSYVTRVAVYGDNLLLCVLGACAILRIFPSELARIGTIDCVKMIT
jgi:hypothetical protein